MNIGAHVSISGGMELAIERGMAMGANAIQTFASPPRTLQFSQLSDEIIKNYLEAKATSTIKIHVFHAVYLVNLASEKRDYVQASIESLINYQQLAGKLGVMGTIFHVGSHKGSGFDAVKDEVAEAIAKIVKMSPKNTILMLENAAGHAGTIGQTVEELEFLIKKAIRLGADGDKIGLCLDTQHAFAGGIDGRKVEDIDNFLERIDSLVGLDRVKVIHINDSKTELASHRDRHENIGDGYLGNEGISNWLNHPKLAHLPFILEVPGREGNGPGKKDVEELQALVQK